MTARPSRDTPAGSAYLDLRKLANATRRPTDELHQLYALEGFLDRVARSVYTGNLVLKGGVLLAAYDLRRPTRDIDFAATDIDGDLDELLSITKRVLAIPAGDGLEFDIAATTIEETRDGDVYPGARAKIVASLASANIRFHIDYNVGDPLSPQPEQIQLPRLLGGDPLRLTGYRIELVLAEKIVTALQRGTANTRWRDFVDIAGLSAASFDPDALTESIRVVAQFREAKLRPLSDVLDGFADLAQPKWIAWRRKHQLHDTPENFVELLELVVSFSDPFLTQGPNRS